MRVGLLSVQWLCNSGSVLVAYAMQRELDRLGVANELIDFRPTPPNEQGEIPSARKEEKASTRTKVARFEEFRRRHLAMSEPLIGISGAADLAYDGYIVGSDTVWTPIRAHDAEAHMFYLEFAKDQAVRRIAWASSIGSDAPEDLEMMRPLLKERLQNFDHLSVRERETAAFLRKLTGREVFHALDPVLMFDAPDYDEIVARDASVRRPYIHTFLFNDPAGAVSTTNELSRRLDLPVVAGVKEPGAIGRVILDCADDGPSEFVGRIFDARYVITDSYHGMICAILARRPFVCYSRIGTGMRARNLLEDLGLRDRFLEEGEDASDLIMEPIDYDRVFHVIRAWRKRSEAYLAEALRSLF